MYVLRIIFPGRVKNWSTVEITTIEGVTVLHKTTLGSTKWTYHKECSFGAFSLCVSVKLIPLLPLEMISVRMYHVL